MMMPNSGIGHDESPDSATRREFLKRTAAGLMTITLAGSEIACVRDQGAGPGSAVFRSGWPPGVQRTWIGPEYWANPLQDWRIADGRLEMVADGPDRSVHLLTRQIGPGDGTLDLRVRLGFTDQIRPPSPSGVGGDEAGPGQAGFYVGVRGPLGEYRNDAVHGTGLRAGLTAGGDLFIEDGERAALETVPPDGVELILSVSTSDGGRLLTLSAQDAESGAALANVSRESLPPDALRGNIALFCDGSGTDSENVDRSMARAWFQDFRADGSLLEVHEDRSFGPVLFTQYTLSRGVMKMTAQMPPLGPDEAHTVQLQLRRDGVWESAAEAAIDDLSRTARFRVEDWDASSDVSYRVACDLRHEGGAETHFYEGIIRREPVDQRTLVMGILSCATHVIFPNVEVADGLRQHDPDLLAFTGDQLYESAGGFGVERRRDDLALSALDYLRKWYMHGWSFGDLMRDRPTICITDDHDVFQGNLWGAGGPAAEELELHNDGGYYMPAEWVNMVQRTQTSHLPDPYDPTPIEQGITVYYTDMLYGRVSMAVLEDRKWKSGPDGLVPPHPGRPDHITDPAFDPTSVDLGEAELLGERQMAFLDAWTDDWRGADLKVVVSQTAFAGVATHHGPEFMHLVADLDSNGWPQTRRNEVLRRFRKGFAFHVGGDQHLPMILRYGVDDFDDAGYIFCVPAIATGYPRSFEPREAGANRPPGSPEHTGQFRDGLGNCFTAHAVANPRRPFRENLLEQQADKVSGYGIVRIDKVDRRFTMEAWPLLSDPSDDAAQFDGWPMTVRMEENYGRQAEAHLPELVFAEAVDPIVQVQDERTGETIYTLRIRGNRFRPKVFRDGTYRVRVGNDDGWIRTLDGVQSTTDPDAAPMEVEVS